MLADQRHSSTLARDDERERTTAKLSGYDHYLTLASPFLTSRRSTDRPSCSPASVTAGIHAVNLDFTGQFGRVRVLDLGAKSLAELVGQHESRLVLAIQVAAQLQR